MLKDLATKLSVSVQSDDVLIPQDLDYPGLELNINREHAALLGISPQSAIDNVITALTSDSMIAPSFWVDPKTGNNYMLTVQYPDNQIKTLNDFEQIPLRRSRIIEHYTPRVAGLHQTDQYSNRGGSLPTSTQLRRICDAEERKI